MSILNFGKYRLTEAFGIPIYIDWSFIILLLLFTTSCHSFALGICCALILALSVTLHELGHALTARTFGYKTSNITISLLGGCANLIALPRKSHQELLTAIAGPAVSFLLAGASYLILTLSPGLSFYSSYILAWSFNLNLMLGAFNLLPGFPMDGGRIFRSVMLMFMSWQKATKVAMIVGRVFAAYLGLTGISRVLNGREWGFVSIMIAYMIWKEAKREYLQVCAESYYDWGGPRDFRAHVSPPPYGGRGDDCDVDKA